MKFAIFVVLGLIAVAAAQHRGEHRDGGRFDGRGRFQGDHRGSPDFGPTRDEFRRHGGFEGPSRYHGGFGGPDRHHGGFGGPGRRPGVFGGPGHRPGGFGGRPSTNAISSSAVPSSSTTAVPSSARPSTPVVTSNTDGLVIVTPSP